MFNAFVLLTIVTEIEYCGPASQEEIQQFCSLPSFHRDNGDERNDMENICDGLIGM